MWGRVWVRQVSRMQETEDSDSEKPTAERHLRQSGEREDGEGSRSLWSP